MAVIKVFTVQGVKELKCFDTLIDVPYLEPEEFVGATEESDAPE